MIPKKRCLLLSLLTAWLVSSCSLFEKKQLKTTDLSTALNCSGGPKILENHDFVVSVGCSGPTLSHVSTTFIESKNPISPLEIELFTILPGDRKMSTSLNSDNFSYGQNITLANYFPKNANIEISLVK